MHLRPGTTLKRGIYQIQRVLGQGTFGITYLAVDVVRGQKVAIKEFFMKDHNGRASDGSLTGMSIGSFTYNYGQKFKKEAENLAQLHHPNIVRVIESFEDYGTYYYVMEYIEGSNLSDFIQVRTVSENEAVEIVKSVASALCYMHDQHKMLHLDIKPGNIMRRASDGHIFLIDFGLSKHFSSDGKPETSTTVGLGTAGYAPVEQGNQARNGEFRPTIDVYALGATLYKLLTGLTPPMPSDLIADPSLHLRTMQGHGVSPEVINIVAKAMMLNANLRYASMHEFEAALYALRSDVAVVVGVGFGPSEPHRLVGSAVQGPTPPVPLTSQPKTKGTSHSSLWILLIIILVVAIGVGIFLYISNNSSSSSNSWVIDDNEPETEYVEEAAVEAAPVSPSDDGLNIAVFSPYDSLYHFVDEEFENYLDVANGHVMLCDENGNELGEAYIEDGYLL